MVFSLLVLGFMQYDGGALNKKRLIKSANVVAVADLNTITALAGPGICSAKGYAYRVDGRIVDNVKGNPAKLFTFYTGKG
jgi:hypothetical protein